MVRSISFALACTVLSSSTALAQYVRVSVSSGGMQANGDSHSPDISGSGRFVAFVSHAANLVANDSNGVSDIFLHDRDTDGDGVFDEAGAIATTRVSEKQGVGGNGLSWRPRLTRDGRYILFESSATNLVPAFSIPPNSSQLYRADRLTGEIALVSVGHTGEAADLGGSEGRASDDGQTIVFFSMSTNLVPGDPGSGGGIFQRDIQNSVTTRLSEPQPPPPLVVSLLPPDDSPLAPQRSPGRDKSPPSLRS